jgi:ankyrin repeat protein
MDLIEASKTNHYELVKKLIDEGTKVDIKDKFGNTPLMYASIKGYIDICTLLIEKGANVKVKNNDNETILQNVLYEIGENTRGVGTGQHCEFIMFDNEDESINEIDEKYEKICRILVENGADINAKSYKYGDQWRNPCFVEKKQALINASIYGYKKICMLLIENGANLIELDMYENTAFSYAVIYGHKEICQLLIENGANINSKCVFQIIGWDDYESESYTALRCAICMGHIDICRLLIEKGADVNKRQHKLDCHGFEEGWTPLMFASYYGKREICELLIENGANIVDTNDCMRNAMTYAPNKEVLELFIEKGFDINARHYEGRTLLMYAVMNENKKLCLFLIEKGADVNAKTKDGLTALMFASKERYIEICKILVDNGADVNAINKDGETALIQALTYIRYSYEICKILIKKGANVNAKDKNGKTPLIYISMHPSYSICKERIEVVKLMFDYGAEIPEIHESIPRSHLWMWDEANKHKEEYNQFVMNQNKIRCHTIKEELMAYVWNPDRDFTKWAIMDEFSDDLHAPVAIGGAGIY